MIHIENEQLATEVMFQLGKMENCFSEDELKLIEEIVIDPVDILGNYAPLPIEILEYFRNLRDVTIRNKLINDSVIQSLAEKQYLTSVCFEKCDFEKAEEVTKLPLKQIHFYDCHVNDFSFLKQMEKLEKLSIVGGRISFQTLELLPHLKTLRVSYSEINGSENFHSDSLEKIYLDHTNIEDFSFLKKVENLNFVSISENQYERNAEFFDQLSQKDIEILQDGFNG